jgi:DNA helicase II / ATP-dependent DNA helicase PcrA
MENILKRLNNEQIEAVKTVEGPVLILAGAGSGKTTVLTSRIAYMIREKGIYPSSILAITFTNKAAGEMRERVKRLIGNEANSMWISTFHSACVRILRREIDKIGYNSNFAIYDSDDQKVLIRICMKELSINDKDITDREIIGKIGDAKDRLISADEFKRENGGNFRQNKIADVYLLYEKKKKGFNALDFDDLIIKTVELFINNKEVLDFYRRKFKYIMVDEYQDTNHAQYKLVNLLSSEHKNICVVGDDDQCLPEGTLLQGEAGPIKVEEIKEGNNIICASGNGETAFGEIDIIKKREYSGKLVKVTTKSGKVIKATPYHITFSRINVIPDAFYVYLMYKKNMGYRIGQTHAVRSRNGELVNGISVRLNGEQGDKIWILKVCRNKNDASYFEQYYSVKYGIPTAVFNARGRRINLSQEQIIKLFKEINTYEAADRLMGDNFLDFNYPHHFSSSVIRGETIRQIVNLSFFSGKKSMERKYYSHRISLNTSGEIKQNLFKDAGFPVRDGQRNTWRIETERVNYDEAEEYAKKITSLDTDLEIIRKAKLTCDKNFYYMPIGSLREGMSIAVREDNRIVEEIIEKVEIEDYQGFVYDFSVSDLRQYIASDIVMHNCIYEWRGADINNILDFEKDYKNAKVIKLEENYRSYGNILKAANSVIKNNTNRKGKSLRTEAADGEKISYFRAENDKDEVRYVTSEILRLKDEGKSFGDIAVLYRTNAQSRLFEEGFLNSVPYKLIGGTRFYERREIKDILSYLKLINNPLDDIGLKRIINVPKRNIGDTTVSKIEEYAKELELSLYNALLDVDSIPGLTPRSVTSANKFLSLINSFIKIKEDMKVSELIKSIINDTGYMESLQKSSLVEDKSRIENIEELVTSAVQFEESSEDKSLAKYLEDITLVADVDKYDENADAVTLMTLHSAKGLEFPVVFMAGMENGVFPGNKSFSAGSEMEESRRLCYVGITRAKERLYLTGAEMRMTYGRCEYHSESDFILEIPKNLIEQAEIRKMVRPEISRKKLFEPDFRAYVNKNTEKRLEENEVKIGSKVKHKIFGKGTVITIDKSSGSTKLKIAFENMGIKDLILDMAPMELI